MSEFDLCFSSSYSEEVGSYKLVELTPELTTLIENAITNNEDLQFTIKGEPDEDAVLCTADKTFGMRSVMLSNTILPVTAVPDEHASQFADDAVVIRDQINEVIELNTIVPKLHKLSVLLKGREYDEWKEDGTENDPNVIPLTIVEAREQIQASNAELERGLKDRRILIINNELTPIAPTFLNDVLKLILNIIVEESMNAFIEKLLSVLHDRHEVSRKVSEQVLQWFGEITNGEWKMNKINVVKELGLGILRGHRHEPIEKEELLMKWKSEVGDTFESTVSLDLLAGNYIELESLGSDVVKLKYFPASALPVDPAARFSDLFLTRAKWKGEEISPFLTDIGINSKERDKLLLKYCRTVTGPDGIRYTARAQYNG